MSEQCARQDAGAAPALARPDRVNRRVRGYWNEHIHDLAISRQIGLLSTQNLELRLETFNLFNTFNWGIPGTELTAGGWQANFNAGTFGRITTQAGAPRIIQLGVKYAF